MANVFEVAKSISIRQVYERYSGNSLDRYRSRGNVSCPLHSDVKPSMHLYDKSNSFYCFSCKKSGSPIDLYKELMSYNCGVVYTDDLEAAKDLCRDFGLPYDVHQPNPAYQDYVKVYKWVADFYHWLLHSNACPNNEYFSERGLESLEKDYLLGYCPSILIDRNNKVVNFKEVLKNQFPNINEAILDSYGIYDSRGDSIMAGRYVFTIFDSKGNPVAFSGRTTDPNNPAKYLNTSETAFFKKRFTLYNYHKAKKYGTVYIVEGYCDALSLVAVGMDNVVAAMGTSFTPDHLELLKEKELILSLDNDKAGKDQMLNLITKHKHIPFQVFVWDEAKDFNDLLSVHPDKVNNLFVKPKLLTAPEFLINYSKEFLDLSTLKDRDTLWVSLASLIGANDKRYLSKYPINTIYTPVSIDYYWTIVKRIIKGKRGI